MREENLGPQFFRRAHRGWIRGEMERGGFLPHQARPDLEEGDPAADWGEWDVPSQFRGLAAEGMQPAIGVPPSRREPDVPRRFNPEINPPSIHAAFEPEDRSVHENLGWHVDHPDPAQRMTPGGPRHIVRHVWSRRRWTEKPRGTGDIHVNDVYTGDDPQEAARATVGKLGELLGKYGPPLHIRNTPIDPATGHGRSEY